MNCNQNLGRYIKLSSKWRRLGVNQVKLSPLESVPITKKIYELMKSCLFRFRSFVIEFMIEQAHENGCLESNEKNQVISFLAMHVQCPVV